MTAFKLELSDHTNFHTIKYAIVMVFLMSRMLQSPALGEMMASQADSMS